MKLEERFITSLRNLGVDTNSSCVVALSGGGDSVALLDLVVKVKAEYHLSCSAARVTHGIRDSESEKIENSFCARLCLEREIPFHPLTAENNAVFDIRSRFGCGTEQAARKIRHQLLREHMKTNKAQYIFYGHTSDDSLETIFMRLLSGSGAEGLGGITALRGEAVRPLLEFERNELRRYLVSNGIDWMEDASNSSDMYRRNRIRNELMPLISDIFPGWPKALNVLGERSREAALALSRLRSKELSSAIECNRYMWNEEDWNSASEYSKALSLWNAFNHLDNSGIPDRRIPWRALKKARTTIDSRRIWNSYGFRLARKHGFIEMSRSGSPVAPEHSGGRIILSRNEVKRGFTANIGSYDIAVSSQRSAYSGATAFRIENWPLEIHFGNYGMKAHSPPRHKTKMPFSKKINDSRKEMIYIFIGKRKQD